MIDATRMDGRTEVVTGVAGGIGRAIAALLVARAAIVSIASDTARVGGWGEAVYAGAKAAVVAFSKSLASRGRPRRDPRQLRLTGGHADRLRGAPWGRSGWEPHRRGRHPRRAHAPGGRGAGGGEAVAFLASPAAGFITGQVLSVNGGVVM